MMLNFSGFLIKTIKVPLESRLMKRFFKLLNQDIIRNLLSKKNDCWYFLKQFLPIVYLYQYYILFLHIKNKGNLCTILDHQQVICNSRYNYRERTLTKKSISCNVVAAYHHDHIFVDKNDAEKAFKTLNDLSQNFKAN